MTAGPDTNARESYLAELNRALDRLGVGQRAELVAQSREALEEAFGDLGRAETLAEIEHDFGSPADLAAALAREAVGPTEGTHASTDDTGRVLGVPYEVRVPTAERVVSRMWNPTDPRLLVPRVFGLGWDLNFGALAVRLKLIRPDDIQDVPFSGVPRAITAGVSWLSFAVTAAVLGWAVISADELPQRIPVHFGVSGPDRFASAGAAALELLGVPLAFLALIVFATFVRRGSSLGRGLAASGTPAIALLGLGMWANALAWARTGSLLVPTVVVVVVPLLVLFGMLLLLTRIGLRAEWREQGIGGR